MEENLTARILYSRSIIQEWIIYKTGWGEWLVSLLSAVVVYHNLRDEEVPLLNLFLFPSKSIVVTQNPVYLYTVTLADEKKYYYGGSAGKN